MIIDILETLSSVFNEVFSISFFLLSLKYIWKYFLSSSLIFINLPYSPFLGIISNSINVYSSE